MAENLKASEIFTGYISRPLQWELHLAIKRFNVIVCHRRFGKTVWAINHMIDQVLSCPKPMPRFAYLAPTYGQAKRVVWDYLKKYTEKIPGAEPNEADLRVDFTSNQGRIMLLSAENPVSLKGIYLDGVILDEYAEMNPQAWVEVIRPTLSDRKGWAIFLGTPKGQNNFYELHEYAKSGKEGRVDPEWYTRIFKASETGILSKEELESNRRTMAEEVYEQEYECSFNAGLTGSYFAKELNSAEKEGRIGAIAHEPMLQVDTYWDLGSNDLMAVWFVQSIYNQHRMIDYYEVSGSDIPGVVKEIQKKPYRLGRFVLPHDANVHDLSTGRTRIQAFRSLGCRQIHVIPRIGDKMESVNAARMMFSKCYFDKVKCEKGLKALANYQRKWDAKNNVFMERPLHNWASNAADAFQQFALGAREDLGESRYNLRNSKGKMASETDYNVFGEES